MARPKAVPPAPPSPSDQTITVPVRDIEALKEELTRVLSNLHTGLYTLQNAAADSIRVAQMVPNRVLTNAGVAVSSLGFNALPMLSNTLTNFPPSGAPAGAVPVAGETPAPELKPGKKQKIKKIKDPNEPPRPVTAYFLFLKEKRPDIKAELGQDAAPGEVQHKATERWKNLPDKEKEKYKVKYKENWKKYEKAMEDYKAQGGHVTAAALAPTSLDAIDSDAAERLHAGIGLAGLDTSSTDDSDDTPPPPPKKAAAPVKKGKPAGAAPPKGMNAAAVKDKSPEKKKKAAPKDTSPEDNKKKRKQTGADDSKKKKRKSDA